MDTVSIQTKPRTIMGKKVKALRRSGETPLHLYGPGGPPLSLQANSAEVRNVIVTAGRTSPVNVEIDGESKPTFTFIRDVAVHPVTGEIQHVDFFRVDADTEIEVPVDVVLVGDAPAIVGGQAVVTQVSRSILVLAPPMGVPQIIEADISGLEEIGDVLRVSDLDLPDGVAPAGHPEDVIARAQKMREAEVFEIVGGEAIDEVEGEEVEGVEGEGAEGTEGADGEPAETTEA
jgi:large subunit ribosomal protein L25